MTKMGRPKKEGGRKQYVQAAFEREELVTLRKMAKAEGCTVSALVRSLTLRTIKSK